MNKAQLGIIVALCTIFGAIGTLAGKVFSNGQERGAEQQRMLELSRRVDRMEQREDYYFGRGEKP